jgi:hypothetical protein
MNTKRNPSLTAAFHFAASPEFLASKEFAALPRAMRLRIREATLINPSHSPKQPTRDTRPTRTQLDTDTNRPFIDDSAYYGMNNIDPGFDLDGAQEFNDSDGSDELFGLTIIDPGHGNIRRWLKGYDII